MNYFHVGILEWEYLLLNVQILSLKECIDVDTYLL
jgi:hypothetical protein